MNKEDIIKITKIDNIKIENTHNGYCFPEQSILTVETREGGTRILDLVAERDITSVEYFKLVETPKTKKRILFKEYEG